MADQNITELPVKTSSGITSSDYMLGIDSAEGYQMLIRDLGDYIIRNVQVNTIAGSNQTLKSALDTLNSKTITAITPSSIPEGITLTRCDEMHVGNLTILELTMRNGDSGIENVRKTFGFNKKYGRILAMTFFGNANTSDTGYTVSLNIPTFSTYTAGTNTTNITFDFGYTDGHPMAYTNNRIHVAHCLLVFADVS